MKSSINRLVLVLYVLATVTMHVADCLAQIQVPEVSYLNEPTSLTCSTSQAFSTIIYKAPSGNVPQCSQTSCTPVSGFQAVPINSTCTQLTILRVQQRHAGQWGCADGDNNFDHRSLVVAESIPACQITSPRDTSSLRIGEDLLLNISISRYYCSDAAPLLLMIGKIDIPLFNETVYDTTKKYFVVKQRMTASHFGIVKLFFECGNFRQALLCEGVQLLSLEYDDSFRSDETGSTAAIVMGIVIIVMIVIIVLLLVKNFRNKNDGCKMCSVITCLPWFDSQVHEYTMPAEDPNQEVHENTMPAEDPTPEVQENTMPAEDPKPEVSEITMPAEDPKPEVSEITMPAEDPNQEVQENTMPAEDPKPEVSEITIPAEDPKPEVPEKKLPAEDPKPKVSEITMPAEDPKPEVSEITMPAEDPKPEVHEITLPAEDPKPGEIHSKTSSSNESTI